ncbi:hypothetical protein EUTSA_v10026817mg [Eutrema salsugineum]|uniref:RNase H type-1 domain-containing protein n=1 Tax=Eutrema salsugineum TaxID=72664 RepID=V4MHS9_EUTSA|nr:hypothetical protein EUTSA_v10026817mg [Eutrema salsugineum]
MSAAGVVVVDLAVAGDDFDIPEVEGEYSNIRDRKVWFPPPSQWVKCNIGASWDKWKRCGGAAWVLSNEKGEVLCHGRRSFVNIGSKSDANLKSWLWAFDSIKSLKFTKIIFAAESDELIGAVNRPPAWPSFKHQSKELLSILGSILEWKVVLEPYEANGGANLIAQNVTREDRWQSYIAYGFPRWLKEFFVNQRSVA